MGRRNGRRAGSLLKFLESLLTAITMDRLTLTSGILFVVADVFAIISLVMPDWIVTEVGGIY